MSPSGGSIASLTSRTNPGLNLVLCLREWIQNADPAVDYWVCFMLVENSPQLMSQSLARHIALAALRMHSGTFMSFRLRTRAERICHHGYKSRKSSREMNFVSRLAGLSCKTCYELICNLTVHNAKHSTHFWFDGNERSTSFCADASNVPPDRGDSCPVPPSASGWEIGVKW